jgi:Fe-coproporphyrin III synthase
MDLSVITTYRCNSKCQMCYIWQNPTLPKEEITPQLLSKLPNGFDNVNITGGEPTLRDDLLEICDVLSPKSRTLEISSNGLKPHLLIPIVEKYPYIKIRFSLEGPEAINNIIRGEKNGFEKKLNGMKELIKAGGKDLGFAFVVQDENAHALMYVYGLTKKMGIELSTSSLHNAWQFHKNDNYHYDRLRSAKSVENLISGLLDTWNVKNWFRAYMNLGLIEKILGHKRLHPCVAGNGFIFIDPWADVWACNVRTDLPMGNLEKSSWQEILESDTARNSIEKVKICEQNCWMVTTARTAMRSSIHPSLPKVSATNWVINNKIKRLFKMDVKFEKYINYNTILPNVINSKSQISKSEDDIKRKSYLSDKFSRKIQSKEEPHYTQGEFYNL